MPTENCVTDADLDYFAKVKNVESGLKTADKSWHEFNKKKYLEPLSWEQADEHCIYFFVQRSTFVMMLWG